jgi:NAD(P)-dependent dehydrogenase (short-subunit alcohol dehydrogenase family)
MLDCFSVGCLGGFLFAQACARKMVDRKRGTIIFTGATASVRGSANFINLAVPKFGLRAVAQVSGGPSAVTADTAR